MSTFPEKTYKAEKKNLKEDVEVWENTLSNFSAQKNQDNMEHTHVKGEKENRGGFEGFYHVFGWCFCCFLQNCIVLQFLKFSRLLLLEPTKGWAVQRRKDLYSLQNLLCDVVNTNLILGKVWLKGYTWLNVSIFQGTHEKSPLWEWKKLLIWCFSDLIKFKSQEQTRRLFGSSCIIVNYHNKKNNPKNPKNQTRIQYLKILWSLPLGKMLLVQWW